MAKMPFLNIKKLKKNFCKKNYLRNKIYLKYIEMEETCFVCKLWKKIRYIELTSDGIRYFCGYKCKNKV